MKAEDEFSPDHLSYVDIFRIRFPIYRSTEEAMQLLLKRLQAGMTTTVSILDMSALNILYVNPEFRKQVEADMLIFNDGAGVRWAAWSRGRSFKTNLNGTDLIPEFLLRIPPGSKVYLLGAEATVAEATFHFLTKVCPKISIVGWHSGFFTEEEEKSIVEELCRLRPQVILVAMGNPQQVAFMYRHRNHPELQGTTWLAVGGLFNFLSGSVKRAPKWMRDYSLEWMFVVCQQPFKWKRYFFGIPRFLWRCLKASVGNGHDRQVKETAANSSYVDILGIRFLILREEEALELLLNNVATKTTTGVAILDMSAANLACTDAEFYQNLQDDFLILNDGAGLQWAAWCRGRPFATNLNGTDLVPKLLNKLPEGSKVYLLGTEKSLIEEARNYVVKSFPQLSVVGYHDGFFSKEEESSLLEELIRLQPQVVLVGMGNPKQVAFIKKYKAHPKLQGIIWIAVGGLFSYWSGNLVRASSCVRSLHLEWLHLVIHQPYKWKRYFFGIPIFLWRCLKASLFKQHDKEQRKK